MPSAAIGRKLAIIRERPAECQPLFDACQRRNSFRLCRLVPKPVRLSPVIQQCLRDFLLAAAGCDAMPSPAAAAGGPPSSVRRRPIPWPGRFPVPAAREAFRSCPRSVPSWHRMDRHDALACVRAARYGALFGNSARNDFKRLCVLDAKAVAVELHDAQVEIEVAAAALRGRPTR